MPDRVFRSLPEDAGGSCVGRLRAASLRDSREERRRTRRMRVRAVDLTANNVARRGCAAPSACWASWSSRRRWRDACNATLRAANDLTRPLAAGLLIAALHRAARRGQACECPRSGENNPRPLQTPPFSMRPSWSPLLPPRRVRRPATCCLRCTS